MRYLFLTTFAIVLMYFSACNNSTEKEIQLIIKEEFSIYPRPRLPIIADNNKVCFYNGGFKNYLMYSIENGEPDKLLDLNSFPLSDMYKSLVDIHSKTYPLTAFDSLYKNPDTYLRKLSSEGLFKSVQGKLYTIIKLPYQYEDPDYILEGVKYKATITNYTHFLAYLSDNLMVEDWFLIDDRLLPDQLACYFPSQLILNEKSLIVPLIMQPGTFKQYQDDIPAYVRLELEQGKFVVSKIYHVKEANWFSNLGEVAVFMSPYYEARQDGSYYIALGNQIRLMDSKSWMISDEVIYEDVSCKKISYIKKKNDTFFYVCGDFNFSASDRLDLLVPIKTSKGKVYAEINPKLSVHPFYDENYLYYIETSEDFIKSTLKVKPLRK